MGNYTYQHDPRISGADFEPDDGDACADCGGYDEDCPKCGLCYYCHGEGWGLAGVDWDYSSDLEDTDLAQKCPCCHGSGKKRDETFW